MAGEAGVDFFAGLDAGRPAAGTGRASVEPVTIGVERGFDEVKFDRDIVSTGKANSLVPGGSFHFEKRHIAGVVMMAEERVTVFVEQVGFDIGNGWIVGNALSDVIPPESFTADKLEISDVWTALAILFELVNERGSRSHSSNIHK